MKRVKALIITTLFIALSLSIKTLYNGSHILVLASIATLIIIGPTLTQHLSKNTQTL